MNNYWLSEHIESDDYDSDDDQSDMDDPKAKLNDRQKMMYDHYEMCTENHGKFDQTPEQMGHTTHLQIKTHLFKKG